MQILIKVPLEPFPEGKVQRKSSKDDRIRENQLYLAMILGANQTGPRYAVGHFNEQWYGWSFGGFFNAGLQLDMIVRLWEFDPEAIDHPDQAQAEDLK